MKHNQNRLPRFVGMKWNQELKYNILFGFLFVLIGETWNFSIEVFFNGTSRWSQINLGGFLLFITFTISYFTVYILNYTVFAPRFLKFNKIPHYVVSFFMMVLCFAAVRFFLEEIVGFYLFGTHNYNLDREHIVAIYLIDSTGYTLRPCLFSSLMYLFFRYRENRELVNELKLQQQEAKMAMLQTQIGPHFLFNTLNGFYSDLYEKNPKEAEGIMKLSQLLRYVTYEVNESTMPLQREITFIKDYLYFYEKRYEEAFNVQLNIEGKIEDQKIPSLILIHFVENVCKHGVIDDPSRSAEIKVLIHEDSIEIQTKNAISNSEKYMDKGIGTQNIRSRLNLLFNDNYQLKYSSDKERFHTHLIMPL